MHRQPGDRGNLDVLAMPQAIARVTVRPFRHECIVEIL